MKRASLACAPEPEHVYDLVVGNTATLGNPRQLRNVAKWLFAETCKLQRKHKIDAIAARGYSGLIPAGTLSVLSGIPLVVIRKTLKDTHSFRRIEGISLDLVQNYIMVDDFIDEGGTMRAVKKAMGAKRNCVAVLNYEAALEKPDMVTAVFGKHCRHIAAYI